MSSQKNCEAVATLYCPSYAVVAVGGRHVVVGGGGGSAKTGVKNQFVSLLLRHLHVLLGLISSIPSLRVNLHGTCFVLLGTSFGKFTVFTVYSILCLFFLMSNKLGGFLEKRGFLGGKAEMRQFWHENV